MKRAATLKRRQVNKQSTELDTKAVADFMAKRYNEVFKCMSMKCSDETVNIKIDNLGEWEVPTDFAVYCVEMHQLLASALSRVSVSKMAFESHNTKMYLAPPKPKSIRKRTVIRKQLRIL